MAVQLLRNFQLPRTRHLAGVFMASITVRLLGRIFDLVLIAAVLVIAIPLGVTIFGAVRAMLETLH